MEDVDNLNVKGLFSSYHLRSNFEASHSLTSSILPSLIFSFLCFFADSLEAWEITEPSTENKKGG